MRLFGWLTAALVLGLAAAPPGRADEVLRATLPNGLRVVIVPDHLAPVVTTEMNYLTGSNDVPKGFPGTAHATEHMMFRGSKDLNRGQLAVVGAQLGGQYNADTTETVTQYTYTVPAADLAVPLRIEAGRMRDLTLSQADWTQERGAIEQEVARDLSNPFYTFLEQAQGLLFAGTPYEHDALGTRASFDATDAKRLRRFYDTWYAPNNAILVVVGDVDPQAALAKVRTAFGGVKPHPLPVHPGFSLQSISEKTLTLPTDFPVGLVALAYRMPGWKSKDFAAADILGDVLSSRRGALYALVPDGRALLSQYSFSPKPDVGIGLALAAFPKGEDPAPVLAAVKGVIADIANNGAPAELVETSKRQEVAQLGFQANSISGLAERWSQALAFRGASSPDDVAKAYEAVTVDDVNRLARTLLQPDGAITAILTPRESGAPVGQSRFGGAESFASVSDHPVVLPAWVKTALGTPHVPAPEAAPFETRLPNGIRLIVQTEHVSHTISLFGHVRTSSDLQQPKGKDGVAGIMRELFDYGTETHDRLAFRAAVDDIAAFLTAGPNFSLRVLTPDFDKGLQLLAENELHPAIPEAAFATVQRQLARSVAGQLQSPDYLFGRAINKAILPADDPGLREATPETVNAVTLADVKTYAASMMRPDLTTIVVVGDITSEAAQKAVEAHFGGWTTEGPPPAVDLPPVGLSGPSDGRVHDASAQQVSVIMGETLGLKVASPDRYALILGNTILGSGFSSRLYRDLRIRTGYVYTVSSDFDWSRTRADYSVSFGADPQNVGKARALVARDLKAMQTETVSEADLTQAKAELLRQLPMGRASVNAIAGGYLRLAELGLPLDQENKAAVDYAGMTGAAVRQAFSQWVRPDDLAVVVKGP